MKSNLIDMNQVLFSPIELSDLDAMIQNSVKKALADIPQSEPIEISDRLDADGACEVLGRTRSWLFKKTMAKNRTDENPLPVSRFGSRLVFSRKELEAWMESQTIPAENPGDVMSDRLAETAKRRDK